MSPSRRYAESLYAFRYGILALYGLLCLCAAFTLTGLRWDGSLERVMLRDDPDRLFNDEVRDLFGGDEVMIIGLPNRPDVYDEAYLQRVSDLTEQLGALPGVVQATSLTHYQAVTSDGGLLQTRPIHERLDEGLSTAQLKNLVEQDAFLIPNVVGEEQDLSAISLRILVEGEEVEARKAALVSQARDVVEREVGPGNYALAGWPVVQAGMSGLMFTDAMTLTPALLAVMTLLLWACFGRIAGVTLPLLATGVTTLFTYSVLVLDGSTITMVTNSLSAVLVALTAAYCVHVLTQVFRKIDAGISKEEAIKHAVDRTAGGIALSALTTATGFAAVRISQVEAIDEFGLYALFGTLFAGLVTLTFVPAALSVLPLRPRAAAKPWLSPLLHPARLLPWIFANRRGIFVTTAVITAFAAIGLSRVEVDTAPSAWFRPDHPVRQDMDNLNAHLVGVTPFNVVFPSPEGPFEPSLLTDIASFQGFLTTQPEVSTSLSVADNLKALAGTLAEDDPSKGAVPDTEAAAAQLGMIWTSTESPLQPALIDEEQNYTNVLLRTTALQSADGIALAERVQRWLDTELPERGARLTGSAFVAYKTNLSFTSDLAASLAWSVGALSVIMLAIFRSVRTGLLAMVPNLVPILLNYSLIGWLGLHLDAGTAITGCIAIGIAVDDTIHLLLGYRRGLRDHPDSPRKALKAALDHVGPALVITSLCLAAGFSVLAFSQVQPIMGLGILVSITMITCVLCDLLLVPAMLAGPSERSSASHPG